MPGSLPSQSWAAHPGFLGTGGSPSVTVSWLLSPKNLTTQNLSGHFQGQERQDVFLKGLRVIKSPSRGECFACVELLLLPPSSPFSTFFSLSMSFQNNGDGSGCAALHHLPLLPLMFSNSACKEVVAATDSARRQCPLLPIPP